VRVRHLTPDEEAESVGPVQPARIFDLLVLACAVEAHLLRQLDVATQCRVGRCGEQAVGPVALIEDEPEEDRSPVEAELVTDDLDLPHAEVAGDEIPSPTLGVEHLHGEVVQRRLLQRPQGKRGLGELELDRRLRSGCDEARGACPAVVDVGDDAESSVGLPADELDRDFECCTVDVGGEAEAVDVEVVDRLEPDRLPDAGRSTVEDV
jgi:hypothetical protein